MMWIMSLRIDYSIRRLDEDVEIYLKKEDRICYS
jgi:hypothetical protein